MPSDCLQADEQLASLIQSTKRCFSRRNYAVNSVARRIKEDVDSLQNIVKQLENDRLQQQGHDDNNNHNSHQCFYSFSSLKAKIAPNKKWCLY